MRTPAPKGILAFTSLCTILLMASACAPKPCPTPCNAETIGNVCQKECDGAYDFQCINYEGTPRCGLPAPCDEAAHCEVRDCWQNVDCSFSKCSYSMEERSEGLYTCSETACCLYSAPSPAGSDCAGGSGSCDGEGNCIQD